MRKSSIEITENEYLIVLSKAEFAYPLVRRLLNTLLRGDLPSKEPTPGDLWLKNCPSDWGERFDSLIDK